MSNSSTTSMRDHAARVQREKGPQTPSRGPEDNQGAGPEVEEIAASVQASADESDAAMFEIEEVGVRVDQPLVMPSLLPVPRPQAVDWIMRNVVAHGAGTHVAVGRVAGWCNEFVDKLTDWQGKQLRSIALIGEFQMQDCFEGRQLMRLNAELYLPLGYGKAIAARLKADPTEIVEFDVDIGLEATGRPIPYAWTVISRHRARSSVRLQRLWGTRTTAVSGLIAAPIKQPAA